MMSSYIPLLFTGLSTEPVMGTPEWKCEGQTNYYYLLLLLQIIIIIVIVVAAADVVVDAV